MIMFPRVRQETCICCYDLSLSQAPCEPLTTHSNIQCGLQCKSIISLAAQPKKQKSIAMPKQTWLWWVHVRWSAGLQWALSRGIFKGQFQYCHLVLTGFRMLPLSNLLLQRTIISLPFTSIPAPIAFKRKPVISVSHTLVLKQPHPFVCLYLQISQPLSVSLKHLCKYQSAPWCRSWVSSHCFLSFCENSVSTMFEFISLAVPGLLNCAGWGLVSIWFNDFLWSKPVLRFTSLFFCLQTLHVPISSLWTSPEANIAKTNPKRKRGKTKQNNYSGLLGPWNSMTKNQQKFTQR